MTFSIEEVFVVGRALVQPLDGVWGRGGVGAEAGPPVRTGLLQQAEAPGLPRGVGRHPAPLARLLRPPQLARLPRERDQRLLLAPNLVPEIWTTENRIESIKL